MSLQIGELADLFGISTKALRHYEKLGLLDPERDVNGYRLYAAEDVLQVQRVRQMQELGLSLRQIRSILHERDNGDLMRSVLHTLLDETASEIEALEARKERIEGLIDGDSAELPLEPIPLPENDKVNAYLEQNLAPAMALQWRRDPDVYNFIGSVLDPSRSSGMFYMPQHEFVGWNVAQQPIGMPRPNFPTYERQFL